MHILVLEWGSVNWHAFLEAALTSIGKRRFVTPARQFELLSSIQTSRRRCLSVENSWGYCRLFRRINARFRRWWCRRRSKRCCTGFCCYWRWSHGFWCMVCYVNIVLTALTNVVGVILKGTTLNLLTWKDEIFKRCKHIQDRKFQLYSPWIQGST